MISLSKNEKELIESVMSKINLSKDKENLEKHVVNLSKCVINLSKKNGVDLGDKKARVIAVLDYSRSMSDLYEDDTMQSALNKLVPLGLTFDDNGSLDVYLFQNDCKKFEDLTIDNYDGYVNKVIKPSKYRYGGTEYSHVLEAIINDNFNGKGLFKKLFKNKTKQDETVFVIFITDGDDSGYDKAQAERIIKKSSEYNMFVQFIGIGHYCSFDFLEKLDNLGDREVDNTGFSRMTDLNKVDDTELYNNVLGQYAEWLNAIKDRRG